MLCLSSDSYSNSSHEFNFTFLNRLGSHLTLLQDSSIASCVPCTSRTERGDGHQSTAPLTAADTHALGYRPRDPLDSRHALGLNFPLVIWHADLVTFQKRKGGFEWEKATQRQELQGSCSLLSSEHHTCSLLAAAEDAGRHLSPTQKPDHKDHPLCSPIMGVSQPCCAGRRGSLLLSTDDRDAEVSKLCNRGKKQRRAENTLTTTNQIAVQEKSGDNVNRTPPPKIKYWN